MEVEYGVGGWGMTFNLPDRLHPCSVELFVCGEVCWFLTRMAKCECVMVNISPAGHGKNCLIDIFQI